MKAYWEVAWKKILAGSAVLVFINVYFGVLLGHRITWGDLIYFDIILLIFGGLSLVFSYHRWKRICSLFQEGINLKHRETEQLLGSKMASFLFKMEDRSRKDVASLTAEMNELTDYIAKWAHEVKLPLASLNLMNERNQDALLQQGMQEGLERIQQLLNTMMMSSKLKSLENDVRYEKLFLEDVVKEVLKNQSFFLIHEHFSIEKELGRTSVYSDKRWLVYLLDQLVANAVKYRGQEPVLSFEAERISQDESVLKVKDNGIGIAWEDIPYIFDKGYIGSNLRNGDYRSTGMGLYFVQKMAERLGIRIAVESYEGGGTQFSLHFRDNASYFILDDGTES